MGVFASIGKAIMHRNSYYLAAIFGGAFVAEIVVDKGVNVLWEWNNQGKLWKDIEYRYANV